MISITGYGSISPLGMDRAAIWEAYNSPDSCIGFDTKKGVHLGSLSQAIGEEVMALRMADKHYKQLDNTALMGILAARKALQEANWSRKNFGINVGSSRGATQLLEQYHSQFINDSTQKLHPLASPSTTSGNIASWIGYDIDNEGVRFSHSITCSTAGHSFLNGIAWLESGLSEQFLVGGTEAPLTDFTISQMQSLKLFSNNKTSHPCRSLDFDKKDNTMILGEGAAIFCLEKDSPNAIANVLGYGFGTEKIPTATGMSKAGTCLQTSMKMALQKAKLTEVDLIIAHAPGTVKGDAAEREAIAQIFPQKTPTTLSNKWKIGHTFGASAALSIELGILILEKQKLPTLAPWNDQIYSNNSIRTVLVNSVGFGGNAVSIILERP